MKYYSAIKRNELVLMKWINLEPIIQSEITQRKTNNLVKKRGKEVNRHFSREDMQMANKHTKSHSTSLIIRETQIKTAMRY